MQYLRKITLVVAGEGTDGLDLSAMRIVFAVKRSDAQSPNSAEITVYNLSDNTARRIRDEFRRVTLQAGYGDNLGIIFDGTIKQVRIGRENGTETYLSIAAADGDVAYNHAVVSKSLAAGATQRDQVDAAIGAMGEFDVAAGFVGPLPEAKLPRGKVLHGMARDTLRDSSATSGTTWSIQNGRVQVISRAGVLPGQAVVLNSDTGLIGSPEQSDNGVKARSLLNPNFAIGGKVKIDAASVQQAALAAPSGEGGADAPSPAEIAADGLYRILLVNHSGDSAGKDWYSDLVCLPMDASAPAGEEVDPQ